MPTKSARNFLVPLVTAASVVAYPGFVEKSALDVSSLAEHAVPLNKQLMSLSIEFDSTVKFFGDVGEPNFFSLKLLQHVTDRAGVSPVLRIGANTQDRASFCKNCNETIRTISNPDSADPKQSEALHVTFNEGLFDVITNNVPLGSRIIFGLNFRNGSLPFAVDEAVALSAYLDPALVMAYELGNEPNFFPGSFRPENYSAKDYGQEMRQWIPRISEELSSRANFMLGSFAGPPVFFSDDMKLNTLVKMDKTAALVNLTNFLDHEKTVDLIRTYINETSAVKAVGGILHMGETGTVACHGKAGVSNTLGAALFQIDYAIQGALAGYARFFWHNGQGDYYYSMWEPQGTELHPGQHIYPTYHGMQFMADLVGDLDRHSIAGLHYLDTSSLVHYAIYEGEQLRKLVLLDLQHYDGTGERSSHEFDVSYILGSEELQYKRLTGNMSAATTGVTWAEQHISNDNGELEGKETFEYAHDGVVKLLATEGTIVERSN
ncbi:hypothetical protein KC331_g4577 [Hortaea werneckii]|nr:hypothetical protein KC331_g4577 [Hortaea werneckii]